MEEESERVSIISLVAGWFFIYLFIIFSSQESNLTDRKKNKRNERNVKFQDAMDITKDAPVRQLC